MKRTESCCKDLRALGSLCLVRVKDWDMGKRNFLIEGVSGTGKTSVCDELIGRGYHALHGDRELRPDRNNVAGHDPLEDKARDTLAHAEWVHRNATWDKAKVLRQIENHNVNVSFFCGGFRNHADLLMLFDGVFVLDIDADTLMRRLAKRPAEEFGGRQAEQALILRLHKTKEDMPRNAISVDATQPIERVADQIIRLTEKER